MKTIVYVKFVDGRRSCFEAGRLGTISLGAYVNIPLGSNDDRNIVCRITGEAYNMLEDVLHVFIDESFDGANAKSFSEFLENNFEVNSYLRKK